MAGSNGVRWDRRLGELTGLSPWATAWVRRVAILAALAGTALGIYATVLHLGLDPFADVRVYYDAGARLNAGQPLYSTDASTHFGLYLNPPLLAILFRPLALLPFPAAVVIWEAVLVVAFALTLRRIGIREPVVIAIGCLAQAIAWSFVIGQVEPVLTLALTLASPWSIAFAGHLKLFPWLAAGYWIVRRDVRALGLFAAWVVGLFLFQLAVEPEATLEFLRLTWLRPAFTVINISPFAVHPLLWVAMLVAIVALLLRYRRTRAAWPLAVALAVLAYPRLLVYQLMSLLAAFGGPKAASPEPADRSPVTGHTSDG